MKLSEAIRAAMLPEHDRLEATPVARALTAGTFDRPLLAAATAVLSALHDVVEPALEADGPVWQALGVPSGRAAAAGGDVRVLGGRPLPGDHALRRLTGAMVRERPGRLAAGYLTIGSRAGSAILAPIISRRLGVPLAHGHGLDLHLDALRPNDWQRARAALDGLADDPATVAQAAAAAADLMRLVTTVFAAIPVSASVSCT